MSNDYVCPERRKTRSDKRAKARFARYKRGGAMRTSNIAISNIPKEDKSKN